MAKKPVQASIAKAKNTKSVEVKSANEVLKTLNVLLEILFHSRIKKSFSKKTQEVLVSYAPWISALLLLLVLPELLIFAKDANLVGITSFFTEIFFNQESWVLLLVVLGNCLLLADGLSDLFNKKRRGWNRIYVAVLLNLGYILSQLAQNVMQPAAPLLSLALVGFMLFALFDIKKYYK